MMRILLSLLLSTYWLLSACDRGDTDLSKAEIDSTVTPNQFLQTVNQSLDVNSEAYAVAYYKAVDPLDERTTLSDWKTLNGFDQGEDVRVIFRDAKDLGYGRDMRAKSFPDGRLAIFVDNYVVEAEPGDASAYGPINLVAAIKQDREYHFGSNAIEFSPDPNDPAGNKIAKFFIYGPIDKNGEQNRIISADLDGRGVKQVPTMCVLCHGGTVYPLRDDGSFDPLTLKSPKLNYIELETLEFSDDAGFTLEDQKDGIDEINQMIFGTYVEMGLRDDAIGDEANWHSGFAESLLEGLYGDASPGDGVLEQNTDYQGDFVPEGWRQTVDRPGGVEVLYQQVVEPHCIGCHSVLGRQVAKANEGSPGSGRLPNAVNFSSFEEFKAYNDEIIDYVYRRGVMPLSLVNFTRFWKNPKAGPTLLATFLDGFDVFDANGQVAVPGRAVARPGENRVVSSSPVIPSASGSLFSAKFSWRIVSDSSSTAELDDPSSETPVLTAQDGATVVLELTTSNARGSSEPVEVSITFDSGVAPDMTFVPEIAQHFIDKSCVACHSTSSAGSGSSNEGIPVYLDEASFQDKKLFYKDVLNRVDLVDPENSLLLRKPTTSLYHGGGTNLDRNNASDAVILNELMNWIRDGAPCGDDPVFCD